MNLITTNKTMSSREIAELTGKEHSNVKRDISAMILQLNYPNKKLKDCPIFNPSELKGHNIQLVPFEHHGNTYDEFLLDQENSMLLVSGYNVSMRQKIIKRWRQLESNAPALPDFSNPVEAARAWADAKESEQKALVQLEEQAPKVEFYEQVTGSTDTVNMSEAAKVLNMGIGRNKLFQFLRDKKVLQDNNQPYQTFIDRGYFRLVEGKYQKPNGDTCINIKTVVYQKGLDYMRKLLNKEGN